MGVDLEQIQSGSIQERSDGNRELSGMGVFLLPYLAQTGGLIAPWWSTRRDIELRSFWKKIDHLSGALYNMVSKMTAIDNSVVAVDPAVEAHVKQAEITTRIIRDFSEFGDGWTTMYGKWVQDLLTQDNGAFAEVIGGGDPAGPIIGQPWGLAHLDSGRCQRTGNSKYPVIYEDTDGARYKIHASRVIYASQMSSPIADMFGVGFCAVSRVINVSQNMYDLTLYKQEKLGSRPLQEILITQGGLDPSDLFAAFKIADQKSDARGRSKYGGIVVGGTATMPEGDVKTVPLHAMPEGSDEQTTIVFGMAAIALGLGVDARELFPAMTAGATRADALLQHLKQRGKGPGQIMQVTEQQLNYKFIPPHLRFRFDFQDDAQDRQVAEIREIRANARVQDVGTGVMNQRTVRERMLQDGDINRSQFERMELMSGRIFDGASVLTLFYNKKYNEFLNMDISDPLDYTANDQEKTIKTIEEKKREVYRFIANSNSTARNWEALRSMAALEYLKMRYQDPEGFSEFDSGSMPAKNTPDYVDPRVRTTDLRNFNADETSNLKPATKPTDQRL